MKKLFNRTLFVLCAVMLLISVVFAWAAAEEAATPTDLIPQEGEIIPEEPGKEPEAEGDGITSVEVVITKTLTVGQSWEGKMKKTKPAVLKLDVAKPGLVYMLVEGKDVWATVEKSDRQAENPTRTKTDPETDRMVISWEAEEGSYLITLGPVEPNLLAMAAVSFMDQNAYDAWEETNIAGNEEEATEEETQGEKIPSEDKEIDSEVDEETSEEADQEETEDALTETTPEETDESIEDEKTESEETVEQDVPFTEDAENRYADITLTWDTEYPVLGDTAHLSAELIGYDEMNYTLQWQNSPDKEQWTDVPDATNSTLDIIMTRDINHYYWRLVVYLEDNQEV